MEVYKNQLLREIENNKALADNPNESAEKKEKAKKSADMRKQRLAALNKNITARQPKLLSSLTQNINSINDKNKKYQG
jgi:hypothetical protein